MKVLVTGRSGAGSWTVRGEQLGGAIGAAVKPLATLRDFRDCDLAIVVKRTPDPLMAALRKSGRRWVLDVVDFYPQPLVSDWSRGEAVRWVRKAIAALRPSALIWPNRRMAEDCDIDLPSTVLYHHHRPGIAVNPLREAVQIVGYEGAPAYLGHWAEIMADECRRRGWRFVINPRHLADLDIVVAFRGAGWDGYAPAHWKSNVKLANAQGSGTPFIGQPECGYSETAAGGEVWADSRRSVSEALDKLTPLAARASAARSFRARAYPLARAADDLREFLHAVAQL